LINTLVLPYLVDKTISLSTRSPTARGRYETEKPSRSNTERKQHSIHTRKNQNIERLNGDDSINATRLLKRQKRKLQAIMRLHEACGHRSVKRLINLKRLAKGKLCQGVVADIKEKQ
jgi:hypothetical protein